MNQSRKQLGLPLFGAMLGLSMVTLLLIWLAPWAMADKYRQQRAREEKILERTENLNAQQSIDRELRKLSIRHKPRPVPHRKAH